MYTCTHMCVYIIEIRKICEIKLGNYVSVHLHSLSPQFCSLFPVEPKPPEITELKDDGRHLPDLRVCVTKASLGHGPICDYF